jgi:hypothetical protein
MKLPKDIDDLMWQVAEDQSPELMDEFAARFPEHKGELVRRIQMVRQLKGARPKGAAAPRRFKVSDPHPTVPLPRWVFALAGCTLLLAGAMAGILVQRFLNPPPSASQGTGGSSDQGASARTGGPSNLPDGRGSSGVGTGEPETPSGTGGSSPSVEPPIPQGPFDQRITIEFDRVSLAAVLDAIALKTGVRLQAAPGMPELEIEARYYDLPAIAILNDLGRNFGFTPLKQTETEALLIPAVDPTRPPSSAPGGFAAEVIGGRGGGEELPPRGDAPNRLPPALSGPINP